MQKSLENIEVLLAKMEEHLRVLTLPPDLKTWKRKGLPGED